MITQADAVLLYGFAFMVCGFGLFLYYIGVEIMRPKRRARKGGRK